MVAKRVCVTNNLLLIATTPCTTTNHYDRCTSFISLIIVEQSDWIEWAILHIYKEHCDKA